MSISSADPPRFIDNMLSALDSAIPADMKQDVKNNLLNIIRISLENMEVVTRQEIEVQEALLKRTRNRINELELRIEELEAQRN